ncbi:hypothetical protein [Solimicrobium silvestre]|uniref:hypothetical protein n=1 Tax=Solimicrobium silvestre TaxID=2099400 RepID=UPI00105715C0|nr:hypothetical protein [Solimicrobium silvestre]
MNELVADSMGALVGDLSVPSVTSFDVYFINAKGVSYVDVSGGCGVHEGRGCGAAGRRAGHGLCACQRAWVYRAGGTTDGVYAGVLAGDWLSDKHSRLRDFS